MSPERSLPPDISGGIDSSVSLGALEAKNVGGQIALQDVQGKLKAADTQGISAENAGSLEIKNAKDVEIRNDVVGQRRSFRHRQLLGCRQGRRNDADGRSRRRCHNRHCQRRGNG